MQDQLDSTDQLLCCCAFNSECFEWWTLITMWSYACEQVFFMIYPSKKHSIVGIVLLASCCAYPSFFNNLVLVSGNRKCYVILSGHRYMLSIASTVDWFANGQEYLHHVYRLYHNSLDAGLMFWICVLALVFGIRVFWQFHFRFAFCFNTQPFFSGK